MAYKVLVVDDSKTARKEISRIIHNHGIITVEAENGKAALDMLKTKKGIFLVFCDVNMPEMNGLEFLENVKNDASLKDIPIIMLTSEATRDVMEKAKGLGVTGWILKPAESMIIKSLLDRFGEQANAG
jgi:two-component system chemotaxis response regulator CheY